MQPATVQLSGGTLAYEWLLTTDEFLTLVEVFAEEFGVPLVAPRLGEIGEPKKEIYSEPVPEHAPAPIETPAPAPAEPEKVPA